MENFCSSFRENLKGPNSLLQLRLLYSDEDSNPPISDDADNSISAANLSKKKRKKGLSEILEPILKSRKRRADEKNVEQKRPKKVLTEIENSFDSGEITQEKGVFDCFNTLSESQSPDHGPFSDSPITQEVDRCDLPNASYQMAMSMPEKPDDNCQMPLSVPKQTISMPKKPRHFKSQFFVAKSSEQCDLIDVELTQVKCKLCFVLIEENSNAAIMEHMHRHQAQLFFNPAKEKYYFDVEKALYDTSLSEINFPRENFRTGFICTSCESRFYDVMSFRLHKCAMDSAHPLRLQIFCRFCNLHLQNIEQRYEHFKKGNLCLLNNKNLEKIVDSETSKSTADNDNKYKVSSKTARTQESDREKWERPLSPTETKGLEATTEDSLVHTCQFRPKRNTEDLDGSLASSNWRDQIFSKMKIAGLKPRYSMTSWLPVKKPPPELFDAYSLSSTLLQSTPKILDDNFQKNVEDAVDFAVARRKLRRQKNHRTWSKFFQKSKHLLKQSEPLIPGLSNWEETGTFPADSEHLEPKQNVEHIQMDPGCKEATSRISCPVLESSPTDSGYRSSSIDIQKYTLNHSHDCESDLISNWNNNFSQDLSNKCWFQVDQQRTCIILPDESSEQYPSQLTVDLSKVSKDHKFFQENCFRSSSPCTDDRVSIKNIQNVLTHSSPRNAGNQSTECCKPPQMKHSPFVSESCGLSAGIFYEQSSSSNRWSPSSFYQCLSPDQQDEETEPVTETDPNSDCNMAGTKESLQFLDSTSKYYFQFGGDDSRPETEDEFSAYTKPQNNICISDAEKRVNQVIKFDDLIDPRLNEDLMENAKLTVLVNRGTRKKEPFRWPSTKEELRQKFPGKTINFGKVNIGQFWDRLLWVYPIDLK